jgi:ABC-type multidrug transport system ATPase subunit
VPRLIIVDEPTAGLDPEERSRLHDVLAEVAEDAVVIISTHIIEDVASLCDRLGVLAGGRLLFTGTPEQLVSQIGTRLWVSDHEPDYGVVLSSRLISRRREPTVEDGYLSVLKGADAC